MPTRRHRAPFWFELCVVVAFGCLLRRYAGGLLSSGPAGDGAPQTQVAFWFFIVAIASAIWKGLEIAGKVTLEVLKWTVAHLSWLLTKTINGLAEVGHFLMMGLKDVWAFTRRLYTDVLKPAWQKFWSWFDKFRRWLDDTFGPILTWLRELRDNVLLFYKTYIRPWLDLIDVTRKALRVLNSLGLHWAGALDRRLGELETAIEKPFRFVLAKLNEIINIVNRIVTVDGLLQRVALIRSIERDYRMVWNSLTAPYRKPVTEADVEETKKLVGARTIADATTDFPKAVLDIGGRHQSLVHEMQSQWRIYLKS